MKKILISVFALVAIASFGGIVTSAHAQTATLTPDETAALQAQLDSLTVELAALQAQVAMQTAASAPITPPVMVQTTYGISTEDITSIQSALSMLASALTSLNAQIALDPTLAAGKEPIISSALQGIGTTLVSIGTTVANSGYVYYPVAATTPSPKGTGSVAQSAPSTQVTPITVPPQDAVSSPSAEGSLAAPAANSIPETAQVASGWSFKKMNWPLTIAIILVLAVIAMWLFWPGEEEKKKVVASMKPMSSGPQVVMQQVNTASTPRPAQPQTPLATAMGAPGMKPQATPMPQQQQRKPA